MRIALSRKHRTTFARLAASVLGEWGTFPWFTRFQFHHQVVTEFDVSGHAAFIPHEADGGGNRPDGRLTSARRSQPARAKRNTDSGPPTHVETGYMIRAATNAR